MPPNDLILPFTILMLTLLQTCHDPDQSYRHFGTTNNKDSDGYNITRLRSRNNPCVNTVPILISVVLRFHRDRNYKPVMIVYIAIPSITIPLRSCHDPVTLLI